MPDHVSRDPVLLVGAGPMAQAYAKVLQALEVPFTTLGRGEASARAFEQATGAKAGTGPLDRQLDALARLPERAIVAVSAVELANTSHALIGRGVRALLIEKPAGLSGAEIGRLNEAARQAGTVAYVAYNRRFYAATRKAQELIAESGGVSSFKFDFTEATARIAQLNKDPRELAAWFLGNSTHVVDLAFFLGGTPSELTSQVGGTLSWHPPGATFTGCGRTTGGAFFSYHADWTAPGRWGVEILTPKLRLVMQPMEELQMQQHGSFALQKVEIEDTLDKTFKPGIHQQVAAFLGGPDAAGLLSLDEHARHMAVYDAMLSAGHHRLAG